MASIRRRSSGWQVRITRKEYRTALTLYFHHPKTEADEKAREDAGAAYLRHITAVKGVLAAWSEFCTAQGIEGDVALRAVGGAVPDWLVDLRASGVFNFIEPNAVEKAEARKLFDRFSVL